MSHPHVCRCPLLNYWGGLEDIDGWVQAPIYRMATLAAATRNWLGTETDNKALWDQTTLPLPYPYCFLAGSATWTVDLEEPEGHPLESVQRRLRCKAIHGLGGSCCQVEYFLDRMRATMLRSPRSAVRATQLFLLEEDEALAQRASGDGELEAREVYFVNRPTLLPQGTIVRLSLAQEEREQSYLSSVPRLCMVGTSDDTASIRFVLDEPACGRTIAEEIAVLHQRGARCRRISDRGMRGTRRQAVVVEAQSVSCLIHPHRLPIVPISAQTYERMIRDSRPS